MRWLFACVLLFTSQLLSAVEPKIDVEYFEKTVRPLLVERCQKCHNAEKTKGGLNLVTKAGLLAGGDTGKAVVPGDAAKSQLVEVIRYASEMKMPPSGKLADAEIAILTNWVNAGTPWPDEKDTATTAAKSFDVAALAAKHWSFQPIRDAAPPSTKFANPIDAFIRAKLQEKGLEPASQAEPEKLLRRVYFDLVGLPPTIAEIDDFKKKHANDAGKAFEEVVDRLLASPHYGERWGRHWLDLVRYAETRGHEFDFEIPDAWRYRDYVVRAFNDNLRFDRIVREHVAGDLLEPRWHPKEQWNEALIATGFWHFGEAKHSPVDVRQDEADRFDNMIDVFGKTFLGLTISCARCHDHKFDPIPTADYYSLYGILGSSRYEHANIENPEQIETVLKELREARGKPEVKSMHSDTKPSEWEKQSKRFEEFSGDWSKRWFANGPGFRNATGHPNSGRDSASLTGSLRSPTFRIESKFLAVQMAGRKANLRLILNNHHLIQDPIYGGLRRTIDHGEEFRWVVFDLAMWPGHAAYLELLDDGDGYAAMREVRFAETPPPKEPGISCEAPPAIPKGDTAAEKRIRELEAKLAAHPRRAIAMADGNGTNEQVFIRGNPKTPGTNVERRFLEAFAGKDAKSPAKGSGRLELARSLTDPKNPLVARVFVNRVWQHHFGVGLVSSPDDFGKQGQPPTHPELLDYLATQFVKTGWDVKKLHKSMLLSETYQLSTKPNAKTAETANRLDPQNKLLHRANGKRLEAEAIRDSILAISGRLDRTVGGPGVLPHLSEHMIGRGRPSTGPLDGNGRRSLYLQVRRNFLNPMFSAFDYPTPFTTIGRRSVSNVPAQGLAMMNNPFVHSEAERWAKRAAKESTDERIVRMYREALGRRPTQIEAETLRDFVGDNPKAWAEVAHAIFNTKEFLFVE